MQPALPFFLFVFLFLVSCTSIDKASHEAARWDNSLNKGSRRLIRHMEHDQG